MVEKQELEVKMGANGLDQVFAEHTGDTLNLNNVQAFLKVSDEQRTERFKSVIEFLRQHPNVTIFTAAASGLCM